MSWRNTVIQIIKFFKSMKGIIIDAIKREGPRRWINGITHKLSYSSIPFIIEYFGVSQYDERSHV